MDTADYDPLVRGPHPVGVRTIEAHDQARGRLFPCEIWYPAQSDARDGAVPDEIRDSAACPGAHPLVVFSHYSGGHRRSATFLCTHLASHGYVVAALDHSEVVAPELARRDDETDAERARRIDAVVASRVPDVRFLLDHLLGSGAAIDTADNGAADDRASDAGASDAGAEDAGAEDAGAEDAGAADNRAADNGIADIEFDASRIGLVGHSFGGWTVLAAPAAEPRVRAVVALAPGGSSNPMPGVLPLTLTFEWGRDVPTMYLAAADDTPIPLAGVVELFERTPASKRMFILRRADHQHFLDDVEGEHEALRAMSLPGPAAWMPAAMRPIAQLCSGEQAHMFVRGLTLGHFDATLRRINAAERFLAGDVVAELAAREVAAIAHGR
jgi:dienelactone hydrolase